MAKIIIVEDDPMISEIYKKKFADAGYEVLTATSGDQTLNLAKNENPDLVLLDLIMPKMDGFQVIENLRGGGYNPNIKIIVSSNLSQPEDREKAMRLGANGFVAKSEYSPNEMVKEVGRLMGQFNAQTKNNGQSGAENSAAGDKSILIIEDEEVFIEMFGDKLKQAGYQVTFARNGAWGVKEAIQEKFDLYIIDMVMPAMTGEEMIGKLKLEDNTKNVPIIVLSASVENEAVNRVKAMGIQEFFVKTQVTPAELVDKVDEILKK